MDKRHTTYPRRGILDVDSHGSHCPSTQKGEPPASQPRNQSTPEADHTWFEVKKPGGFTHPSRQHAIRLAAPAHRYSKRIMPFLDMDIGQPNPHGNSGIKKTIMAWQGLAFHGLQVEWTSAQKSPRTHKSDFLISPMSGLSARWAEM